MRVSLYTDGGSRGNPGDAGIGFRILEGEVVLREGGDFIGRATNNIAEYRALIWGLENARDLGATHVDVNADSELMIKQLKGEYKVKNEGLKPLFQQARTTLSGFESFHLAHVRREANAEADRLANEAMDARARVGDDATPALGSSLFDEGSEQRMERKAGTPLYKMTCKAHFDSAHSLVGYPGECKNLHGHTWDIEVTVTGSTLDDVGIMYDFKDLKRDMREIIDPLDHAYLNDIPPFDEMNATAENLSRYIYEEMEKRLTGHVRIEEVAVWESPIAKIVYSVVEDR